MRQFFNQTAGSTGSIVGAIVSYLAAALCLAMLSYQYEERHPGFKRFANSNSGQTLLFVSALPTGGVVRLTALNLWRRMRGE
jgi:hypothetical protein